MELVFVGPHDFLCMVAKALPEATRHAGPLEVLDRDDTAFVCPMSPSGQLLHDVYDSKAMFRGSQTNMRKTVAAAGYEDSCGRRYMPLSSALGISVWGSAWLIGSVSDRFASCHRGSVAKDAFYAAYVVASGLPGIKRLVCPPLCVESGRIGMGASAAQIARSYKEAGRMCEQYAVSSADSRGVPCYFAVFRGE